MSEQQEDGPKLEFVEPSPDPHLNVLLYGPPKSGKTVGAASIPGPTLYLNADRPNATRKAHEMFPGDLKEVHVEGLETLIAAAQVISRGGEYRSVVLDPVGDVHREVLEGLSGRALSPPINLYGDANTHVERFCRALCGHPINAVFVAHDIALQDEESGEIEHWPFMGTKGGTPIAAAKLMAMVDVIGYTGVVPGEDDAPTRYMAQLINARGRRGGDRFGVLGDARELNLAEWVELAQNSNAPKGQKAGKA